MPNETVASASLVAILLPGSVPASADARIDARIDARNASNAIVTLLKETTGNSARLVGTRRTQHTSWLHSINSESIARKAGAPRQGAPGDPLRPPEPRERVRRVDVLLFSISPLSLSLSLSFSRVLARYRAGARPGRQRERSPALRLVSGVKRPGITAAARRLSGTRARRQRGPTKDSRTMSGRTGSCQNISPRPRESRRSRAPKQLHLMDGVR